MRRRHSAPSHSQDAGPAVEKSGCEGEKQPWPRALAAEGSCRLQAWRGLTARRSPSLAWSRGGRFFLLRRREGCFPCGARGPGQADAAQQGRAQVRSGSGSGPGLVWCGLVWSACGLVWCGMVRSCSGNCGCRGGTRAERGWEEGVEGIGGDWKGLEGVYADCRRGEGVCAVCSAQ